MEEQRAYWKANEAELPGNLSSEEELARLAIADPWIGKTGQWREGSRIFHEGIDAEEIRLVENVQGRHVKLNTGVFLDLEKFVNGHVGKVGGLVLRDIARDIAKRRSENRLGHAAVGDEVNVAHIHRDWRAAEPGAADIEGIEADELVGDRRTANRLRSGDSKESARVSREDADRADRRVSVAEERPG